jgi:energy-coupling factor transporter transmembrane protein EcfT
VFSLVVLVTLFGLRSGVSLALLSVYLLVLFFLAGGKPTELQTHARRLSWLGGAIIVLNGVFVRGEPMVSIGGTTLLSLQGVLSGGFFALRHVVLYLSMVVLLLMTPPVAFARALFRLCGPFSRRLAGRVALFGFLTLSFLPLFAEEIERVRTAQSFRGASLDRGWLRRLRAARALIVPLVLSALYRSAQLAAVVELRGLKNRIGEAVTLERVGVRDLVHAAVAIGVLSAAFLLGKLIPGV